MLLICSLASASSSTRSPATARKVDQYHQVLISAQQWAAVMIVLLSYNDPPQKCLKRSSSSSCRETWKYCRSCLFFHHRPCNNQWCHTGFSQMEHFCVIDMFPSSLCPSHLANRRESLEGLLIKTGVFNSCKYAINTETISVLLCTVKFKFVCVVTFKGERETACKEHKWEKMSQIRIILSIQYFFRWRYLNLRPPDPISSPVSTTNK